MEQISSLLTIVMALSGLAGCKSKSKEDTTGTSEDVFKLWAMF